MGLVQLWEGKPLIDDGLIAISEDCCCDVFCIGCFQCIDSITPLFQYLTFGDVIQGDGDDPCLDCDDWNRQHKIPLWTDDAPCSCNWFARGPGACAAAQFPTYNLVDTIPCNGVIECYAAGIGFEVKVLQCYEGGGRTVWEGFVAYGLGLTPCMAVGNVPWDGIPHDTEYCDWTNLTVATCFASGTP